MNTSEGCASISDNQGRLLFYTDGLRVWNRLQQVMPNGSGLKGDPSSSNSAIVIPKPGSNTIYYIFTADAGENNNVKGYNYSEVDMTLDGGLGDITANKNILLYAPSSEQLTAVRDAGGIDIWVITKVWGNNEWRSYKVDCNGVNTTPIESFAGVSRDSVWNVILYGMPATQNVGSAGCLKASPDGKRIAATTTISNRWEIFDFDNSTGTVSNALLFPLFAAYGLEFSPDSRLIYVASEYWGYYQGKIYQYNLATYDSASIAATGVEAGSAIPFRQIGALQAGPDNKIYCAQENDTALAVINSPNTPGLACNYVNKQVGLGGKLCLRALPVFFPSLISNQNAGFTYNVNNDCSTVTFSGNSTVTGSLTYTWDFGDGAAGTGQNPTHIYGPGSTIDTVKLTVTTNAHCGNAIAVQPVNLTRNVPVAHFGFALQCGNPVVQFTDSSTSSGSTIQSWLWDFGDGNISVQPSPSHAYAGYGNFAATLTVTSSGACNGSDIARATIPIEAKPNANFSYSRVCMGQPATFTDQSTIASGAITKWYWDFGDGSHSRMQDTTKTYSSAQLYAVKLAVTSASGCVSDTMTKDLAVSSLHIDSISVTDTCYGSATRFKGAVKAIDDNIASWWWDLGTANAATSGPSNVYPSAGPYVIRMAVAGGSGCLSDTLTRRITIRTRPVADFTAGNGCVGSSIPLTNGASDASGPVTANYWNFGDGATASGNQPAHSYAQFGDFTIRHAATSEAGCLSDTLSHTVNIQSAPIIDFQFGNTCVGKSVQFTNLSHNDSGQIIQWAWSFGNGQQANAFSPSYTYNVFGNYPVSLSAGTSNGCQASLTREIVISPVNVSAGRDTTVAIGEPLQLQASGAENYAWTPPNYLDDPGSDHPIATLPGGMTYYLAGTTAQGCKGYDTINIIAYKDPDIYVPNAFTPNGDGHNDILRPIIPGVRELSYFSIYNRWGELVFYTKTPGVGWDGRFKGGDAPQGTYVWMLKLTDYHGKVIERRGVVMLIR